MVKRLGIILLALALPLFSTPAADAAEQDSPLVPAAAELVGLRDGREGSAFEEPLFGPVLTCDEIDRQFVIMNPTIVEGEPLLLRLLLRTETPRVGREFHGRLAFGTGIRVVVIPPAGIRPYEYLGLEEGSLVPNNVLQMEGYKQYRYQFRMAVDQNTITGAAFAEPGQYELRISQECVVDGESIGMLDMGTFTITVKEAKGPDRCALDVLDADYEMFEYFQLRMSRYPNTSRPMSGAQAEKLMRIIDGCKGAALRPHAMIVMAEYYLREKDIEKSNAMLRRVIEEYPALPFHDEALFALLRNSYSDDDPWSSLAAFNEIWADPITTVLITPPSNNYKRFVVPFKMKSEDANTQWMLFAEPGTDPESESEDETQEPAGPQLQLSEEMQDQFGLPEYVTQEELNDAMKQMMNARE